MAQQDKPVDPSFFEALHRLGNHALLSGAMHVAVNKDWPMVSGLMNYLENNAYHLGPLENLKATADITEKQGGGTHQNVDCSLTRTVAKLIANATDDASVPDELRCETLLKRYLKMVKHSDGGSPTYTAKVADDLLCLSLTCKMDKTLSDILVAHGATSDPLYHKNKSLFSIAINFNANELATQLLDRYSPSQAREFINTSYLDTSQSYGSSAPMHDLCHNVGTFHGAISRNLVHNTHDCMDFVEALWDRASQEPGARIAHMAFAMTALYVQSDDRTQASDDAFFERLATSPFAKDMRQAMADYAALPLTNKKWEQCDLGPEERTNGCYVAHEPDMLRIVLGHGITQMFDVCRPLALSSAKEHKGPSFEEVILTPQSHMVTKDQLRVINDHVANQTFDYLLECGHDLERIASGRYTNTPASAAQACAKLKGDELKHMLPMLLSKGVDVEPQGTHIEPLDKALWDNILLAHKAKQASSELLKSLSRVHP